MRTSGVKSDQMTPSNLLTDGGNRRPQEYKAQEKCIYADEADVAPITNSRLKNQLKYNQWVPRMRESDHLKPQLSDDHLGYDWIAAMLDNQKCYGQTRTGDQPANMNWLSHSDLFEQIAKFRQINYDACCSQNYSDALSMQQPKKNPSMSTGSRIRARMNQLRPVRVESATPKERIQSPAIYSYTLNTRLFPIPSDVATAERPPPQPGQDHILRVTIPLQYFRRPPELLRKIIAVQTSTRNFKHLLDGTKVSGGGGTILTSGTVSHQPSALGPMSLSAHCYPQKNKPHTAHRARSCSTSSGLSCQSHLPDLAENLRTSENLEYHADLPKWLHYLPKNENEAIKSLLRNKRCG